MEREASRAESQCLLPVRPSVCLTGALALSEAFCKEDCHLFGGRHARGREEGIGWRDGGGRAGRGRGGVVRAGIRHLVNVVTIIIIILSSLSSMS